MLLYFDLDRGRLVSSPGSGDSLSSLDLKRGDTLPVILRFTRGLTVQELSSGATGRIGLKSVGDYDGAYLAADLEWTKSGTGTDTTYTFVLDLNTVAINTALGVGEPADLASIPVNFELEFVESGNTTSSQTVLATLHNDVNRGDEESPANAPSVALLRDGTVQTLTTEQKAQVHTNLSLVPGTDVETPAGADAKIAAALTAKANLTGGNTFSGTQNNSGEVRSTAALSGDGTQILNRNQVDGSAADFIWTPIAFNTPAGTAAGSVALSATQFTMTVNSGSSVGETKYASSFIGPFLDIGSVSTQITAQKFTAYFDLTPQSQMDECPVTLLFGVGATVTSIASVAGLAVKFTENTVKLQIHNGTTLEESSAITIPNFNFNTNNRVLVTWDGNTLRLYMKNWSGGGTVAEQRYTLIGSLAHSSALPATFSGASFVVSRTTETTTTATATLRLRSCQTLATALSPNL
jgi:hypothetical protein